MVKLVQDVQIVQVVQVVKVVSRGVAYRVPGGQGLGLQGLTVSRGRPKGSQGVKGYAYRASGGQGDHTATFDWPSDDL